MKKLILMIVAVGMVLPAMAVDFDMYGDVRLGVWFEMRERWYYDTNTIKLDSSFVGNDLKIDTTVEMGKDSIPTYLCSWVPFGNFGFRAKGDKIGACLELGIGENLSDASFPSITSAILYTRRDLIIYMRKWYAEWYINDLMTILIGQDNALTNLVVSNQGYMDQNSLTNMGCLASGSRPMIKLSVGGEVGSFFKLESSVAALKPDTVKIPIQYQNRTTLIETRLPKAEGRVGVNYEKDFFACNLKTAMGFQRFYSVLREGRVPLDSTKVAIDSWVVGGEVGIKIGPFSVAYTASKVKNPGSYRIAHGNPWSWRIGSAADPHIKDVYYPYHDKDSIFTGGDTIAYWRLKHSNLFQMAGVLKFKPWEFLSFEGGGGWVMIDHDYDYFEDVVWVDRYAGYFQIEITIAECLVITPEIGQFLWGREAKHGGRFSYFGLMTNIAL